MTEESLLQPGRINSLLYSIFSNSFDELYNHVRLGMSQSCPKFLVLQFQAEVHSKEYTASRSIYDNEQKLLDMKYSPSKNNMSVREHIERLQSVVDLMHRIGSFRLYDRDPYPEERIADDVNLNSFRYDVDKVNSDIPLVKSLTSFYYDELRESYRNRPDAVRKRDASIRAKRSYVFYLKYKEYEKTGFNKKKIEDIFGIPLEEQKIIEYWLPEILHSGLSTTVFAKPGKGKSNFSSFMIQLILVFRPDWEIVTNVPLIFSPDMQGEKRFPDYRIDKVHFIHNATELLLESVAIGRKKKIPAVIIDEFDSALISTEMRGKPGENLKRYIYLERHYDVQGPLFIYHARKDIPVAMRDMNLSHDVFMITRYHSNITGKDKKVLTNPTRWLEGRQGLRYFPIYLSLVPYHNKGTSPFDIMDVDMTWLNSHVKGTGEDALNQIEEFVQKKSWDKTLEKKIQREKDRQEREEMENRRRESIAQRRLQDQMKRMGKKNGD